MRKLWIQLRSSLWFVPSLLVSAGALLALILVQVDISYSGSLAWRSWHPLLNAGAEGARGMLSAIATSLITVAGVAFSVTIVTLSMASAQYTPRILRNFMRKPANQLVLGAFVAIYTYCLIVMRTIRGSHEDDGGFVPLVSVAVGMVLALVSIACLIFFIHHTAASIQAAEILNDVARQTRKTIDRLFPDQLGEAAGDTDDEEVPGDWVAVKAHRSGYVQAISADRLLRLAEEKSLQFRLERGPGDFVVEDLPLIWTSRELDEETVAKVQGTFALNSFRTIEQDLSFGIRQIVDIAMKALSPGINDSSTAVSCLDYLSEILTHIADRSLSQRLGSENRDEKRLIASSPLFADFVGGALNEIRLSAYGNVTVLTHLLCTLQRVAARTRDGRRREILMAHAILITETADHTVVAPFDRARINAVLQDFREVFGASEAEVPDLSAMRDVPAWT